MRRSILFICTIFCCLSCKPKIDYHKVSGETMGTYYVVTYKGTAPQQTSQEIDQLLINFNNSLSTYIPTSFISQLNDSKNGIPLPKEEIYFKPVLDAADSLYQITNGYLNVAIMPMLTYWRDNATKIDSALARELNTLVAQSKFELQVNNGSAHIDKSDPKAKLDFSSLAKGYGIDVIAAYLNDKGITDYLIDIGGEARAKGTNNQGSVWTLAINTPREGSGLTESELFIQLRDKSIATSGTYRQFYLKDGRKIAHIMNPNTGFSTTSNILSASVIDDDCMIADGLATALMVCTLEEAKEMARSNKIPVCLIYDADGIDPLEQYFDNGFDAFVLR